MDDELLIVAAALAALLIMRNRQQQAAAALAAGTAPTVSGPTTGAAADPADLAALGACVIGTTAAGVPLLAAGCKPVVTLADGTLRSLPVYAYAADPALLLVNPVIGVDKIGDVLPWNW